MFHRPHFDVPDPFPSFCSTPPLSAPTARLMTGIRRVSCATPPGGLLFGHLTESTLLTKRVLRVELATDLGRCGPAASLSQDICELQFAVKELSRQMQQPNAKNMQVLIRLVRFLKASPRCLSFLVDKPVSKLFTSSQMLGGHLRVASATTQKCGCDKIGRRGVLRVNQECFEGSWCGAIAADMAKVVRGLHTKVLWVQEAVARRELTIARVPGCENPDHETLGSEGDARVH